MKATNILSLSSFAKNGNSIIKQPLRSDFLGLRHMAVRGLGKWSGRCGGLMAQSSSCNFVMRYLARRTSIQHSKRDA